MKLPVTYRGATPADDQEMRAFLHRSPSGGDVRLRIEKEPSFHEAFEVEGEQGDILLANDVDTGAIVGVGARAAKRAFVNGRMEPLGYLSTLRIDPAYRGGKVLKAGYIRFKEFHDAGRARLYTTTIMTSNVIAVRALTQGRPGLPLYNDYGGYVTHIFAVRRNPFKARGNVTIRQAKAPDALAMQEFWRREGEKRQFFPLYTARHVVEPGGLLRGLNVWDFMLAERDGSIVGTIALWNQMPFRQWVIDGYSRRAGMVMPAYNLFARATGRPTFPKGGEALDYRFLSLFVVADNDEKVALSLLSAIWKKAHETAPESLLVGGNHERDPLAHLLQRPQGVRFHSRLFVVHWEDGKEAFAALDDRVPYLEVGSL